MALFIPACGKQSEVTAVKLDPFTTTSTFAKVATLVTQTTTTTVSIPSTTTTIYKVNPAPKSKHIGVTQKVSSWKVWDDLADCEADGNWALDALYDGGLQFDPAGTWTPYVAAGKPYALKGYPAYAYQATREQQIVVAIRVRDGVKGSSDPYLNAQGYGAWPTCRHVVGV